MVVVVVIDSDSGSGRGSGWRRNLWLVVVMGHCYSKDKIKNNLKNEKKFKKSYEGQKEKILNKS